MLALNWLISVAGAGNLKGWSLKDNEPKGRVVLIPALFLCRTSRPELIANSIIFIILLAINFCLLILSQGTSNSCTMDIKGVLDLYYQRLVQTQYTHTTARG